MLFRSLTNAVVTANGGPTASVNNIAASLRPNPIKETGSLKLSLPKTSNIEIEIFDAGGKRSAAVFSGRLSKGEHFIDLHASVSRLPAGVYWFRIHSAEDQLSLKFVKQ